MKTIEIKAYEFKELSDKAKERARDWYRGHNCDDNYWSECTIEEAISQGNLMGITFKERQIPLMGGKTRGEACIYWSGFCSQGDGACFEGTWRASDCQSDEVAEGWGDDPATTEIKRIAKVFSEIAKKFPCSSFSVEHRGHYYHEHCTDFSFESGADYCDPDQLDRYRTPEDNPDDPDSIPRDRMNEDFPEEKLKEAAKDFMKWIYRQLEKEYNYRNSDECVDEEIADNEYLFTEEGKRCAAL